MPAQVSPSLGLHYASRATLALISNHVTQLRARKINHVIIADQTVKTHGRKCDRTRVDVSCLCSCQLETFLISPRMRKGRQTGFLTRFDPWGNEIEEKFQGDMSKPRKTTKLNGKALRLPCTGFSWTDHKKRHDILESKNACHHCSHDSDLRKMKRLYINDSLHHGKPQE